MECLEKELETLKDETDEELVEAKRSIRNEVKMKLGELIADAEKIKKNEIEQVKARQSARLLIINCAEDKFCAGIEST